VSNFQRVWRYSCVNLARKDQIFVCEDGWKAKFTKKKWTQETNRSLALWTVLPSYSKNAKTTSAELHVLLPRGLKSGIELDGGIFEHFLAIYRDHLYNQLVQSTRHLSFLHIFFKAFYAWHSNSCNAQWKLDKHFKELSYLNNPHYYLPKIFTVHPETPCISYVELVASRLKKKSL